MVKYFLFFGKTLPLSQIFLDGKFVFSEAESLLGQDGWRQGRVGGRLETNYSLWSDWRERERVRLHPTLNSPSTPGEF